MLNTARLIGCSIVAAVELGAWSVAGATWIPNGIPVCTAAGTPSMPLIISDERGGAIIAWTDARSGNNDIYAQRVSGGGELLWDTNGLPVCIDPAAQTLQDMTSDGSGAVIIVWSDGRSPNGGIYGQSVSADGVARWTPGGAPVCTPSPGFSALKVVPVGAGDAIIGWIRYEENTANGENVIYAQKLTASGSLAWDINGVRCATIEECFESNFNIVPDSQGGAIFICRCCILGCLWGQRIDGNGNACWGPNGHEVAGAQCDPFNIAVASDGFGGALVVFRDVIFGGGIFTLDVLRAQRITRDGTAIWSPDIALDYADFSWMAIAPDAVGGAIVVWERYSGSEVIMTQRLDAAGSFQWGSGLTVEGNGDWWELLPKVIPDGSGGVVLAWMDREGIDNLNIYAQRIGRDGDLIWAERVPLCTEQGNQSNPLITTNCAGGAVVAWMDGRISTQGELYAQTINGAGVPGESPVAAQLERFSSSVVADGVEVTWTLSRVGQAVRFETERTKGSSGGFEPFSTAIERDGLLHRFIDRDVASGGSYQYRVFIDEGSGRRMLFETRAIVVPRGWLVLRQNRPNPFNPSTVIDYYLPTAGRVTVGIFDVRGRLVVKLVDETRARGEHSIRWSGLDARGATVPSGVYFYRLTIGKESASRKMLLCR